jgi:hypothetical protein
MEGNQTSRREPALRRGRKQRRRGTVDPALTRSLASYTLLAGSRSQPIVQKRLFAVPKPSRSAPRLGTDPDPLLESWDGNSKKLSTGEPGV